MPKQKTLEEEIRIAEKENEEAANRLKDLRRKKKEQDDKVKAQRQQERGAILESLIEGAEDMMNDEIETLLMNALTVPAIPVEKPSEP